MAESGRIERLLFALSLVYALGAVLLTIWLQLFGDRQPVGILLVYGPRWPMLVPGVVLSLVALVLRAWREVALAAGATLVAFFGYLDFNVPIAFGAHDGTRLRVVTYNVQRRDLREEWLVRFLARERPDVMAIIECRPKPGFSAPGGYHFGQSPGMCLLSRFPITATDARDQRDALARGGNAAITLFTVEPPEAPSFQVLLVHLESPRGGIEALMRSPLGGIDEGQENIALRRWEAGLTREWLARADRPALVMGDFNLTEESAIFARHFEDLDSAFDRCGLGFGNTKHTRKFGARIDHILMTEAFECEDAEVLDVKGSDHRPLAAILVLRS